MSEIGIGSMVWVFSENRRVYPKGGGISCRPIYREHWEPLRIVGETRVSWLLEHRGKVPKKPKGRGGDVAFSEAELDMHCWAYEHRYAVVCLVERARPNVLRQVAALVGYKESA